MKLAQHDIDALLEQAARKEAMASDVPSPRDPCWRGHLVDAADAYARAGRPEDAARCLAAAAEQKACHEAASEPQEASEDVPEAVQRPVRRPRR